MKTVPRSVQNRPKWCPGATKIDQSGAQERSVSELELRLRVLCYVAQDEQRASGPQPDRRWDASAQSSGCYAERLKAHHESARASRQRTKR